MHPSLIWVLLLKPNQYMARLNQVPLCKEMSRRPVQEEMFPPPSSSSSWTGTIHNHSLCEHSTDLFYSFAADGMKAQQRSAVKVFFVVVFQQTRCFNVLTNPVRSRLNQKQKIWWRDESRTSLLFLSCLIFLYTVYTCICIYRSLFHWIESKMMMSAAEHINVHCFSNEPSVTSSPSQVTPPPSPTSNQPCEGGDGKRCDASMHCVCEKFRVRVIWTSPTSTHSRVP